MFQIRGRVVTLGSSVKCVDGYNRGLYELEYAA